MWRCMDAHDKWADVPIYMLYGMSLIEITNSDKDSGENHTNYNAYNTLLVNC